MFTKIPEWLAHEPVRAYFYSVGGGALVVLNAYGFLADDKVALWGNLLALVLVPAAEKARARVRPVFPPE